MAFRPLSDEEDIDADVPLAEEDIEDEDELEEE